jgi:hypothetical protein
MSHVRIISFLALLASGVIALLAASSFAADNSPQAFLQGIYMVYEKSEKAVDIGSETKAARYFVRSVARLIGRDVAEAAKKNEVGRLDFDPFIGGQDWEPTKIEIGVAAGAPPKSATKSATGTARFLPPGKTEQTTVTLDLSKTAAGWRIADIHWAGQPDSLVALLTRKD